VREQWMLLAPEKLFQPDEIMAEILNRWMGHGA